MGKYENNTVFKYAIFVLAILTLKCVMWDKCSYFRNNSIK